MHFKLVTENAALCFGSRPAMIDGAQGVASALYGEQAIAFGGFRRAQQVDEEIGGYAGHIAGDDQIPVGGGRLQSGADAAERSAIAIAIGEGRQSEMSVALGGADQRYGRGRGANASGNVFDQRGISPRQQGFILPHAETASTGQHEPGMGTARSFPGAEGFHEKIVPISREKMVTISRCGTGVVESNKKVYICCLAVLVMLAASPMRAADSAGASSLLSPPQHAPTVSTIRVDRRTGKLVRVISGPGAPESRSTRPISIPPPPARIGELVERSARANNVDPLLVQSVIQVESNYNTYAVSNKGAEGLMQLMPSTSRMLGVTNSFDPVENIEAGVKYLKYLQSLYHDDRLALAAYNAGPGAVSKYSEVPPYPETQNYVERVGQRYRAAHDAAAAAVPADRAAGSQAVQSPPVEEKPVLEQFIDSDGRLHLKTVPRTQ